MEKLFENIFTENKKIYTKNLVNEKSVYGEKIIEKNGCLYREWNPFRSKYCAGLKKGLKKNIFSKNSNTLYLGSAEGTTVSHVSDIIEEKGTVFCVDVSETAMQKLLGLAEKRENIVPILADAKLPKEYKSDVGMVDSLFQDISQRDQTEIFLKHSDFLKKNCYGVLSLKTKSISQANSKETLNIEKKKLEKEFIIEQIISLEPFEKEHYLLLMKKK